MAKEYDPAICPFCHGEFTPTRANQYTCGQPKCKRERNRASAAKWYARNRKSRLRKLARAYKLRKEGKK